MFQHVWEPSYTCVSHSHVWYCTCVGGKHAAQPMWAQDRADITIDVLIGQTRKQQETWFETNVPVGSFFFHWRAERNWKGEESKVYIVIFFLIRKKDIIQNQINYLKVTECYVKERNVCDVTNIWNFNCTWILYFKLYLKKQEKKRKKVLYFVTFLCRDKMCHVLALPRAKDNCLSCYQFHSVACSCSE